MILADFANPDVRINSEYYSNLVQQDRNLRRKSKVWELYYLHDNAPIHTSAVSTAAIQGSGVTVILHLPYSPNLASSNFYLFNHLKRSLRGRQFATKMDLKDTVINLLAKKVAKFLPKRIRGCLLQEVCRRSREFY